jgi:predicted ABC-type ATPase
MRVMEGGHDVPIPKIIGRYTKSLAYCSAVAWLADRTYVYDNSVDNARAKLLFRASKGRLVKVYGEINPWAQEIMKRLLPVQSDDAPPAA